ncbi:MAG: hypothetical protein IKX61_02945 [Prevotella sp.]|nr:hypothetical protein [Prevotella sp.]
MNKKTVITALLALVAMTISAQEKLIRIDSEDIAWQEKNPQYIFFNKEMARLLMPQDAAFGVECIPSFSPEWSLTYDSVAHTLVYKEAQKSIWYSTYAAMYKKKTKTKNGRRITKRKLRNHPKDYMAPDVKTFTLAINARSAQMLKFIFSDAIRTSEPKVDTMLDGITWIYFIGDQRAKAREGSNNNPFSIVRLTDKLVEAVKAGDASRCDSLINAEFQHVVANLEIVPNLKE